MEYREFGTTGMRLSTVGLGGLLAHYWEGESGHPAPEEKQQIYLQAAESGINLFDTGYGDEVHIPKELKGGAYISWGSRGITHRIGDSPKRASDEVEN